MSLASCIAAAACFFQVVAAGGTFARYSSISSSSIKSVLGRNLSSKASIVVPTDANFVNASSRWNEWETPQVVAVVEVFTESDVLATVSYAQLTGHRFLAQNAGHGFGDLSATKNAIIISIQNMNSIALDSSKKTVTVGAGVGTEDLINYLYANKKQTTVGTCDCVGFLGATLGGGHGRLQGLHGLIVDNLISARVLLANGRIVTASEKSEPGLFYALRGAGHNFGIVLQAQYRVYDTINNGDNYDGTQIFTADALEDLFTAADNLVLPPQASIYFLFIVDPSTATPLIVLDLVYAGPEADGKALMDANFGHITPVQRVDAVIPWNQLGIQGVAGFAPILCTRGERKNTITVNTMTFNVADMRASWNEYAAFVTAHPEASQSMWLIEAYPLQAVQAINESNTAFPGRQDRFILLEIAWYVNASLDDAATAYGNKVRSILQSHSGFSKPRVYLNYARGDEELGEMYGHDQARLSKLVNLKRQYDPLGAFDSYHPIPTSL